MCLIQQDPFEGCDRAFFSRDRQSNEEAGMAWQLSGRLIEACSCKAACPCVLGPAEPDQGWCSGALTFAVDKGESDGVDLSGRTVVWLIDLPKDFVSGDGTACVIIDDRADSRQRQELEAIFSGKKGGPGAVFGSLVSKWIPSETAPIELVDGDDPEITVGTMGHVKLQAIKDGTGKQTVVFNAPVLGLVEISEARLAKSDGSRFAAPQMRSWTSGGHGSISPFTWKA